MCSFLCLYGYNTDRLKSLMWCKHSLDTGALCPIVSISPIFHTHIRLLGTGGVLQTDTVQWLNTLKLFHLFSHWTDEGKMNPALVTSFGARVCGGIGDRI